MSETGEMIESLKAVKELMDLFKEAQEKMLPIQELFVQFVREGNPQPWLDAINAVSDLDHDMAHGCIIVALSVMARIKVGLEGTECYDKVKEIFTPKVS